MSVSSTTSKKIRAIAAGGAVLGLGAVITLAAWSDSEFAEGIFASGTFGIEAATDGTTFGDHSDEAGALTLTADATEFSPGETQAFPYQIRKIADSVDTRVLYESAPTTTGELVNFLDVTVLQTEAIECTPDTTGTELAPGATFDLTETADQQNLCLQVTLDETFDNPASQDANFVWEFSATEAPETPEV